MALDDHFIAFDRCLDSHLIQHFQNSLGPVAFLVGEAADSGETACALTEGGKDRYDREEVRAIRCVNAERLERSTLDSDVSPVSVELRKACSGIHEYIHDGKVGLEGSGVKSLKLSLSEDRTGNKEIRRSAPVAFKIYVRSLVPLPALDLEDHLCAERPVAVRSKEIWPSKHIVSDPDAEFLEDFEGYEHIWNALRLMHYERAVLFSERQGHEKAGYELRAVLARYLRATGVQWACDCERDADRIV